MDFTVIEGVELLTVGMDWPASTGPASYSLEHLQDIITAAEQDSHVRPPRVKIGHGVQLVGDLGDHDPYWDGEPALGSIANLRLENDGAVLVGDFVGVPQWLADAMASAYPTRSVETVGPITTPAGKQYLCVLTACAVGSWQPAVADLEDLQILIEDGPEALAATQASASPERSPMPKQTSASVDTGVIRQRFNYDWAMDPESTFEDADGKAVDTYWWWARSVRVDPNEVIADDDDGGLWLIPFSTDGEDAVTFGEPQRVRETFIPVNASAGTKLQALTERHGQKVLASELSRPEKAAPNPAAEPEANNDTPEEGRMSIDIPALRTRLELTEEDLPDDATEEQINAALAAEEPEAEEEPTEPEAEVTEPEPVAASDGTVTVDKEAFEQVQRQAKEGAAARAEQINIDRERKLDAAVKAGKIPPARKDHYRDLHKADPEGTEELLASLAENTVPVVETGVTQIDDDAEYAAIRASLGLTNRKEG